MSPHSRFSQPKSTPPRAPKTAAKSLSHKHPGPRRIPRSSAEATLAAIDSATVARRRRIDGKARRWLALFTEQGFQDPERASIAAGYREPGTGYRLARRLSDLVEAERLRIQAAAHMDLDETLRVIAAIARDSSDRKVQLSAALGMAKIHGALSDKPLPPTDRRDLIRQIEELAAAMTQKLAVPGVKTRVSAALAVRVDAESPGNTPSHAPSDASTPQFQQDCIGNAEISASDVLEIAPSKLPS